MTTLIEIAAQLKEPFALEEIDFLPKGKIERDGKTLCMALPYADPRVYQDRLNAVAYGEWSTPAPVVVVAGNKLICYVTIILCSVAHTDVGEAMNNEENTGTEAWAQGFKRACSQFGLGRYLYDLEKEWVPFDLKSKRIELDAAGKRAIVRKMYQKAGIAVAGQPTPAKLEPVTRNTAQPQQSQPQQATQSSQPAVATRSAAPAPATQENGSKAAITEQQLSSIRKLCERLGKAAPMNLEAFSFNDGGKTIAQLTQEYRSRKVLV